MLKEQPNGLFTPMAVAVVADQYFRAYSGRTADPKSSIAKLESLVLRVEKAGLPAQSRLFCFRFIEPLLQIVEGAVGKKRTQLVALEDVLRVSRSPILRRKYLQDAILESLRKGDIIEAHRLSQPLLGEFAKKSRVRGRTELLSMWLHAGRIQESERMVREWQGDLSAAEIAEPIALLGDYYRSKKDYLSAQAFYDEVICIGPETNAAVAATLGLAQIMRENGQEERRIALLKDVTEMKSVDSHAHIMDAGNSQSIAYQELAKYYMEKGDWHEALKWWRSWKPQSWCGTCLSGMREHREKNIQLCRERLLGQGLLVREEPTDRAEGWGPADDEVEAGFPAQNPGRFRRALTAVLVFSIFFASVALLRNHRRRFAFK